MTTRDRRVVRLWILLLIVGCIAISLQAANILFIARLANCDPLRLTCPGPDIPWFTPDTQTYIKIATQIHNDGFLHTSFLIRPPGYPLLIALMTRLFGFPSTTVWVAVVMAGSAAIAIGWTVFEFTGSTPQAVLGSLVSCWWPNTFQYTPLFLTDALHAYVMVLAFVLTVLWYKTQKISTAFLAMGLWIVAQSLRPTLFILPFILPVLLWGIGVRQINRKLVGLWAASGIVPVFIMVSNYVHHGTFMLSRQNAQRYVEYTIPRTQELMGLGEFDDLREKAQARYRYFSNLDERAAAQNREFIEFVKQHPLPTLLGFFKEFADQLFDPFHIAADPRHEWWRLKALVPPWWSICFYWMLALAGVIALARRQPAIACFLAVLFIGIMLPAISTHWAGARFRFPLDLIFLPVVTTFIGTSICRANSASDP